MMNRLLKGLLCLGVMVLLTRSTIAAGPRVNALKINGISPVINGNLNDPCWEKAQWQSGFYLLRDNAKPTQNTRFKVLYDKQKLYFAVECFEQNLDMIRAISKKKDSVVHSDDCVEIFLMPEKHVSSDLNVVEFYQFITNSTGVQYDSFYKAGIGNRNWNAKWKSATTRTKKSWILEIAIPFYNFNIKASTDSIWRLNVTRNRTCGKRELSSWSAMIHSFSQPSKFGYLDGLKVDFNDYLFSVSAPEVSTVLQDDKAIPALKINITNNTAKPQNTELEVQLIRGADIAMNRKSKKIAAKGTVKEILNFADITKSGKYTCNIVLSTNDRIVRFDEYSVNIDVLPLKVTMIKPKYRNTIFPTQKIKNILLDVKLSASAAKLKNYSVKFLIKNKKDGKLLIQKKIEHPKINFVVKFDAQKLSFGNYIVETVLLEKGKTVCTLNKALYKVAKTTGNEVRIGDDLNLIINGKKIFPHSFMATGLDEAAKRIRNKGFNFGHSYVVQYYDILKAKTTFLDRALKQNRPMIFYPYHKTRITFFGFNNRKKPAPELSKKQMSDMINRIGELRAHRGVLGWYLCDEPRGVEFRKGLKNIYKTLRKIDPYHPVFAADNTASGCITLSDSADVLALDYYPNFKRNAKSFKPLITVYNNVMKIRRATNDKLPVWYIPQAFNRSKFYKDSENYPYRGPTYFESRCMNYLALTAGAKGIMYYKLIGKAGVLDDHEMTIAIVDGLGPELNDLSPVLLQKTINGASASNSKIYLMLKKYKGNYFLAATNPTYETIKNVTLKINGLKTSKMKVLFEDRTLKTSNDIFKDNFAPLEVHVYTSKHNFKDSVKIKDILSRIKNEK